MEPDALDPYRFVGARRALIEKIRGKGISDLQLLRLFDEVPRHAFLPEAVQHRAYEDAAIPIGHAQTASQPSLQAYMLQQVDPQPTDTVLEIGTGCGFLTALLAQLAERVYSVERNRTLSVRAREALDGLGYRNIALLVGDGTIGWRKFAPFDVIVVSAASPTIPEALTDQLAEGGRMVIPVGERNEQRLVFVRKQGGRILQEALNDRVAFVPLVGRFGWKIEGAE